MNRIKETVAKGALATGLFLGIGSCSVDVITCPGEVERGNHELPSVYCDENPDSDNLFNSPGTTEQKLMYAGFGLAVLGAGALVLVKRDEQPIAQDVVRGHEL